MTNSQEEDKPEQSVEAVVEALRLRIQQVAREVSDPQVDNAEWLRNRLLETISSIVTAERVRVILEPYEGADMDARVDDLASSVAKAVRGFFDPFELRQTISRKGAKRQHQERDREMLSLRKAGLTLSQITQKLRREGLLESSNEENDAQTVASALTRMEKEEQKGREAVALCEQMSVLIDRLRAISPHKSGPK